MKMKEEALDLEKELRVDVERYKKYKNEYIKKDGTEELPFWESWQTESNNGERSNAKRETVLITGGTGSFGKKCVEIILKEYKPEKLIIFSRDELKQFELAQVFPERIKIDV